MRSLIAVTLAVSALSSGLSGAAFAQTVSEDYWPRATPVDQSYSIETPCTTLELEELSGAPLNINGSIAEPDSTVQCMTDGVMFSSGILTADASELNGMKLFDIVLDQVAEKGVPGSVDARQTSISGKRVILSREIVEGEVAQTGVVEMSDTKLLMLISGGIARFSEGEAQDVSVAIEMIDRYTNSLQVPSQ